MRRYLIFAAVALALMSFPAPASLFRPSLSASDRPVAEPSKASARSERRAPRDLHLERETPLPLKETVK